MRNKWDPVVCCRAIAHIRAMELSAEKENRRKGQRSEVGGKGEKQREYKRLI